MTDHARLADALIADLIAASDLLRAQCWRGIESAPKDGTRVLLRYRWAHREVYVAEGWWDARRDGWYGHMLAGIRATHWMSKPT